MDNSKASKEETKATDGIPTKQKAAPKAPPSAAAPADTDQTRDAPSSPTSYASASGAGEARVTNASEQGVGPHDVLLGRGGATNSHEGNRKFRTLVAEHQQEYLKARKREKVGIARRIVAIVHNNGGRFLKRTDNAQNWIEVTEKRAQEKTSQALREGLDVRNNTIRPSKMIKEVRPAAAATSATTQQHRERVVVPTGQAVQISVPQFSPNSTVSHHHAMQYTVVPAGSLAYSIPQYRSETAPLMNPVLLHYPVITQKDVKRQREV